MTMKELGRLAREWVKDRFKDHPPTELDCQQAFLDGAAAYASKQTVDFFRNRVNTYDHTLRTLRTDGVITEATMVEYMNKNPFRPLLVKGEALGNAKKAEVTHLGRKQPHLSQPPLH